MKKGDVLLFQAAFFYLLLSYNNLFGLAVWHSPEGHLSYQDVCFFTSHNSYAAQEHGYYYAQQRLSIKEQLQAGVRGLMLDTHKNSLTGEVILCHRNEWVNRIIRAGKAHMNMSEAIDVIKEFLHANPTEIITIFLENYVSDKNLIDSAFTTVEPWILTPSLWDPLEKRGWPTIGWMQKQNKRLIIFNSIEKTRLMYNQWHHVIENQWGALSHKYACRERPESKACRSHTRHLYLVNYFPRLKINFGAGYEIVNSTELDTLLHRLHESGLGNGYCKQRLPNFISLDFVDEGDGLRRVNEINKRLMK